MLRYVPPRAPFHKGGEVYPSPIFRQLLSKLFLATAALEAPRLRLKKHRGFERARSIAANPGLSTDCHERSAGLGK
jgi:hypothetical protein